jgi:hypothetical protein
MFVFGCHKRTISGKVRDCAAKGSVAADVPRARPARSVWSCLVCLSVRECIREFVCVCVCVSLLFVNRSIHDTIDLPAVSAPNVTIRDLPKSVVAPLLFEVPSGHDDVFFFFFFWVLCESLVVERPEWHGNESHALSVVLILFRFVASGRIFQRANWQSNGNRTGFSFLHSRSLVRVLTPFTTVAEFGVCHSKVSQVGQHTSKRSTPQIANVSPTNKTMSHSGESVSLRQLRPPSLPFTVRTQRPFSILLL